MLNPKILRLTLILISIATFLQAQEIVRNADHKNPSIEKTRFIMLIDDAHQKQLSAAGSSVTGKDFAVGNVAVIPANLRTLIPVNRFDLTGWKITFTPVPSGGYTVQASYGTVSEQRGNKLNEEKVDFSSGFTFPFYGKNYSSVYVRRCGDLSFAPTSESCTDLIAAYSDVPKILANNVPANYYNCSDTSIFTEQTPDRFMVTYDFHFDCDYYLPQQIGTFQINLFRNGTIEFLSKGSFDAGGSSLTGISPGGLELKDVRMVDYTSTVATHVDAHTAVFERFANVQNIDFEALLQQFHNHYAKDYDFVTIFTDRFYTDRYYSSSGFEFLPVQNKTRGIGLSVFDFSQKFGSSRLKSVILMDSADQLPENPHDRVILTMNTLQLMGHLIGRTWAPYAGVSINGRRRADLFGQRNFSSGLPFSTQTWNFFMDTDASVMGGNDIKDNGDGTFTTVDATKRYSKLDQYLMGLIPASDVPPFFFVRTDSQETWQAPQIGQTFSGQKVNVQINQIVKANNVPRIPSSENAQQQFRNAFIYFISPESTPDSRQLTKIEKIRTEWQKFFKAATNQHATIDTTLTKGRQH